MWEEGESAAGAAGGGETERDLPLLASAAREAERRARLGEAPRRRQPRGWAEGVGGRPGPAPAPAPNTGTVAARGVRGHVGAWGPGRRPGACPALTWGSADRAAGTGTGTPAGFGRARGAGGTGTEREGGWGEGSAAATVSPRRGQGEPRVPQREPRRCRGGRGRSSAASKPAKGPLVPGDMAPSPSRRAWDGAAGGSRLARSPARPRDGTAPGTAGEGGGRAGGRWAPPRRRPSGAGAGSRERPWRHGAAGDLRCPRPAGLRHGGDAAALPPAQPGPPAGWAGAPHAAAAAPYLDEVFVDPFGEGFLLDPVSLICKRGEGRGG